MRRVAEVGSPLVISSGKRPIVTFDFLEIALFQEDGAYYVKEHIIAMYPVLPTMQGVDHVLMRTAMDELFEFCRGREERFAEQFVWMEILLERTETIAAREKERIRRELQVYDSLWENHPRVKQIRAEVAASKAQLEAQFKKGRAQLEAERAQVEKGKAQLEAERAQLEKGRVQLEAQLEKGRVQLEAQLEAERAQLEKGRAQLETEGEVHGLQHAIVTLVRVRYPALIQMAQQKVAHLDKIDALNFLFEQISAQTTEDGVRALLLPTVA